MNRLMPRILIIDDNQLDAQLLREAFTDHGFNPAVIWAPLGLVGLEFLATIAEGGGPRLVVLDLNMPAVGGTDILRSLRQDERFRDVRVVVLTTSSLDSDRAACEALGVDAYLRKPTVFSEYGSVVDTIRGLVGGCPAPVAVAAVVDDEG